jgi:hypothetical protein
MALSIIDVAGDRKGLKLFLELPGYIYATDPYYCPSPKNAVLAELARGEFAEAQRTLVAIDNGRPAARVVARLSPALRDEDGRPLGMLGFFEALEDTEAVGQIIEESVRWLRDAGAGTIVGPMNGDTWHSYRFSTGPFDSAPFLMEPHNPPYYPEMWEDCGFEVLETYYSQHVTDARAFADGLEEKHERAASAGYTMRRLDAGRFVEELEVIHRISSESFAGNFLYSDIPLAEFVRMYAGARRLLDPDLTWFAQAPDGTVAGFLFAFPDELKAVAAMRGRRDPFALLRFMRARGGADTVNIKTAGVARSHRRMGLFAAMTFRALREAHRKGYGAVNLCLIKDGNPSGILAESLATVLRHYALYRYAG